jgi:hypothetical protein
LHHKDDPATSREAAEAVVVSGKKDSQKKAVYEALKRWNGSTSAELAAIMDIERHIPARRLSELADVDGVIRRGKARFCAVTRNRCVTWWITGTEARRVV